MDENKGTFSSVLTVVEVGSEFSYGSKGGIGKNYMCNSESAGAIKCGVFQKGLISFLDAAKEPFKADLEWKQTPKKDNPEESWTNYSIKQAYKPDGTAVYEKGSWGGGSGGMSAEAAKELGAATIRASAFRELGEMIRFAIPYDAETAQQDRFDIDQLLKIWHDAVLPAIRKATQKATETSTQKPQDNAQASKASAPAQGIIGTLSRDSQPANAGDLMQWATKGLGYTVKEVKDMLKTNPAEYDATKLIAAWEWLWDQSVTKKESAPLAEKAAAIIDDSDLDPGPMPEALPGEWGNVKTPGDLLSIAMKEGCENKAEMLKMLNITDFRGKNIQELTKKLYDIMLGDPTDQSSGGSDWDELQGATGDEGWQG